MKPDERKNQKENKNKDKTGNKSLNLHDRVREFEANLIKTALAKADGNQRKAAEMLGVKATTLHQKIKAYGIKLKLTPANFDN